MHLDGNTGLVLEGGGMRGVFTAGVLDFLLDRNIYFPYVVAVSAGACNGLSYMSRQRGRARRSDIDCLQKYRYIGLKYLWSQHSILDLETLYKRLPAEILPFDYDTYFKNPSVFEMVATDCETGRAVYLTERDNPEQLINKVRASSSLPYACPVVWVDGRPLLDGGLADSIPVERAFSSGFTQNVVVLTRNRGYRTHAKDHKLPAFVYKKYPRLRVLLSRRHAIYDRQLELVEKLEDEGRILVIRPQRPLEVTRLGQNIEKLSALYEEGYAVAEQTFRSVTTAF